jgi:hypothetical protein
VNLSPETLGGESYVSIPLGVVELSRKRLPELPSWLVEGGIMAKNDGKPWTREDVKALREQARDRNVSTDKIAKNLGRTVAAVRAEAQRKDISLKPKNR